VDDVSTFWFGPLVGITNGAWAQVTVMKFTGEDSAMAFTWQNVTVAGEESATKSAIVRFGPYGSSSLSLDQRLLEDSLLR
jgi:hypothetical protein